MGQIQTLDYQGGMLFLEKGRLYKSLRDEEEEGLKLYQYLGEYENWTDFLKSGHLGSQKSMVYFFIDCYTTFIEMHELDHDMVAKVPMDKLQIILPSVRLLSKQEEVIDLLHQADVLSRSDLIQQLHDMRVKGKLPAGKQKDREPTPDPDENKSRETMLIEFRLHHVCGRYRPNIDHDLVCTCKHD